MRKLTPIWCQLRHSITLTQRTRFLFPATAFILLATSNSGIVAANPDLDTSHRARAEGLLQQMTLVEKIGQLNLISQGEPVAGQLALVRAGRIGSMMNVVDGSLIETYRAAAAQSRLKIPLLFGIDAIDAFRIAFPPPIAWAATWRPELAQAAARSIAGETAAMGINWTFAPMVDISRDPRWGRVVEGAGEDPMLASAFAAARVRGYRAGGLNPTAKHFVGYGAGEAGRDYNSALIPPSDLYDRHLPPFKAAIEAGAHSVMTALNAINGVPATANSYLLNDVLRTDLGFKGFVVADYNAIGELKNHGLTADLAAASRIALLSGVDLDMEADGYNLHLANELEARRIQLADIDRAVTRILEAKFKMGLFDGRPARPPAPPEAETRRVARQVARESIVLLKNHNAILPIASGVKTIAIVGSAAKSDHDESWYGPALLTKPAAQTLHDALAERLKPHQRLLYAPALTDACGKTLADVGGAAATAAQADLIVVLVGEDCEFSGEGASRTSLDLSPAQRDMIDLLAATGKPLVVVVTAGRPLTLARIADKADAVVFAWLPRTEGRTAIAEILTGEINPSGKLPMTFPRSVGQIPISYNVLPTSRPPNENRYTSRYLDEAVTPLYPFGFGLSYTTFAYSNLRPAAPTLAQRGQIAIDVDVTNTGSRAGDEVAQLYIRRPVASRSRPVRELKAFEKIRLRPGETQTVRFQLTADSLIFHDDAGKPVIEGGPIQLFVGTNSDATLTAQIVLD